MFEVAKEKVLESSFLNNYFQNSSRSSKKLTQAINSDVSHRWLVPLTIHTCKIDEINCTLEVRAHFFFIHAIEDEKEKCLHPVFFRFSKLL